VGGVVVCGDVANGVIEMEEDDVESLAAAASPTAAATTTATTGGGSGMGAKSATGGDGGGVIVTEGLEESSLSSSSSSSSSMNRKRGRCARRRRTSAGRNSNSSNNSSPTSAPSANTPVLVPFADSDQNDRQPSKRLRGVHGQRVAVYHGSSDDDDATESSSDSIPLLVSGEPTVVEEEKAAQSSPTLTGLPEDVVGHCLSFLGGLPDRYALQCTSKQFRRISNSDEMLLGIQVGGDKQTGLHGIISEKDTPETASDALEPFVNAGNLEAIYM
jgi:hypothetical protein